MNVTDLVKLFGSGVKWTDGIAADGKHRIYGEGQPFMVELIPAESVTLTCPREHPLLFSLLDFFLGNREHGARFINEAAPFCVKNPHSPYVLSLQGFVLALVALPMPEREYLYRLTINPD